MYIYIYVQYMYTYTHVYSELPCICMYIHIYIHGLPTKPHVKILEMIIVMLILIECEKISAYSWLGSSKKGAMAPSETAARKVPHRSWGGMSSGRSISTRNNYFHECVGWSNSNFGDPSCLLFLKTSF